MHLADGGRKERVRRGRTHGVLQCVVVVDLRVHLVTKGMRHCWRGSALELKMSDSLVNIKFLLVHFPNRTSYLWPVLPSMQYWCLALKSTDNIGLTQRL